MPRQPEPPLPTLHPTFAGPFVPLHSTVMCSQGETEAQGHLPARGSPHSVPQLPFPRRNSTHLPQKSAPPPSQVPFQHNGTPACSAHGFCWKKKPLFFEIYNLLEAPDSVAQLPTTMGHPSASCNPTGTREQTPAVLQPHRTPLKTRGNMSLPPDLLHPMGWGRTPSRSSFFLIPHGGSVMGGILGCPAKPP